MSRPTYETSPTALRSHAATVDTVADGIDTAVQAAETTLNTGAFGVLCQFLPPFISTSQTQTRDAADGRHLRRHRDHLEHPLLEGGDPPRAEPDMSGNALVAPAASPTTALSGTGLLESVSASAQAIENKDWVGAALGGFATTMDAVASAIDPIGTLIAWGAGWLIDHLQPMKGWLDDLTGDAGAVAGFAQTWVDVGTQLQEEAAYLTNRVSAELEGITGEAITAYGTYASQLAAHIGGMQDAATAVAGGLRIASTIVQVVHELVRDTLAQIIGSLSSAILQAVFRLGTLIPKVCADVAARVAAVSARIGATVKAVVEAFGTLRNLVKQLGELMGELAGRLRRRDPGGPAGGGGAGTPASGRPTTASWSPDAVRDRDSAPPDVVRRATQTAQEHLTRFGPDEGNDAMLARIRQTVAAGRPLHPSELNFLRHELTEARLMDDHGMAYDPAHAIAMKQHPTYANYHPDVIQGFSERFNTNYLRYWGLPTP